MRTSVSLGGIGAWLDGGLESPELVLGPREIEHNGRRALSVRAFLPDSRQAWVIDGSHGAGETSRPMRRIHPSGLFEAICPWNENAKQQPYRIRALDGGGEMTTLHDPYYFEPLLTDFDLLRPGDRDSDHRLFHGELG